LAGYCKLDWLPMRFTDLVLSPPRCRHHDAFVSGLVTRGLCPENGIYSSIVTGIGITSRCKTAGLQRSATQLASRQTTATSRHRRRRRPATSHLGSQIAIVPKACRSWLGFHRRQVKKILSDSVNDTLWNATRPGLAISADRSAVNYIGDGRDALMRIRGLRFAV
jgi:hypothetical protein